MAKPYQATEKSASLQEIPNLSYVNQDSGQLKLSFTSIALGLNEFSLLVHQYLKYQNWANTLSIVTNENLLQRRSAASTKRVFREIRQRIEHLTGQTLVDFMEASPEDQRAIVYLAICKCYRFIFDFACLMLRDKLIVFDYDLLDEDFSAFWNRMAIDHPELNEVSESTRKKIRQVTLRILAEAGLLSETKAPKITPLPLSSRMEAILEREGRHYREAFLSL